MRSSRRANSDEVGPGIREDVSDYGCNLFGTAPYVGNSKFMAANPAARELSL